MRPGLFAAARRLFEAAMLLISLWIGFNKRHRAFVLLAEIEIPIRIQNGALTQLILFLPTRFAALEILAGPPFSVRVTINKIAHVDHAPVMVHHDFVGINLACAELAFIP